MHGLQGLGSLLPAAPRAFHICVLENTNSNLYRYHTRRYTRDIRIGTSFACVTSEFSPHHNHQHHGCGSAGVGLVAHVTARGVGEEWDTRASRSPRLVVVPHGNLLRSGFFDNRRLLFNRSTVRLCLFSSLHDESLIVTSFNSLRPCRRLPLVRRVR